MKSIIIINGTTLLINRTTINVTITLLNYYWRLNMRKTMIIVSIFSLLAVLFALFSIADTQKPVPQTVCPVMGGKISKSLFVDAAGKRIYVCCAGCISTIEADPAKYIAQLEKEGVTLDKATVPQTVCPVMGGKIDKNIFVDVNGKRVYLCCKGCENQVKADPVKYIALIENEGVTLETAPCCESGKKCPLKESSVTNP